MTRNLKNIVFAMILVVLSICTSGCFEMGGGCYIDSTGQIQCDVDMGNGGDYGYQNDFVMIEWDSGYYDDPNVYVTDLQVSCEFTIKDFEGNRSDFTVVGDVYIVDGYMSYIYFDGVGPLFDAECTGAVAYNNGPAIALFDDDSMTDGNVTQVTWEMDVVSENDVRERNYELKIDRL